MNVGADCMKLTCHKFCGCHCSFVDVCLLLVVLFVASRENTKPIPATKKDKKAHAKKEKNKKEHDCHPKGATAGFVPG